MKKQRLIPGCNLMLQQKGFLILMYFTLMMVLSALVYDVNAESGGYLKDSIQETSVDDETLINCVVPFPSRWFLTDPEDERAKRLMDHYLTAIFKWNEVLIKEFELLPGHDNMGYFGEDIHVRNSIRTICYGVFIDAFLSKVKRFPPGIDVTEKQSHQMEDCAIKCLRYLTYSHVTGEGECLGGGKWGNHWQSSLLTRAAAMAGWILWEDLDKELKIDVARMLEFEANRFIGAEPKSQVMDDTGAEENAWNTHCTSLAYNMMPLHPNRDKWDEAARKYMYNSFSVAADHTDRTVGDDGKTINEWVTTVNAHPDFTVENHTRVHIGYLKNTLCMLVENGLNYELMGNKIPDAMYHHVPDAFEILEKSMMSDACPVYWGSNDWRVLHTQAIDILGYAAMNVLKGDRAAAYLEDVAIDYTHAVQDKNNGFFNFRRDLTWSGFAATRMINAWFLHAILGGGSTPLSEQEYDKLFNNVTYFPYGKTIIHRTSTKFASFSWNSYLLALSFNKNGQWQNWPRESSYFGIINGSEADRKHTVVESIDPEIMESGFTVTGRIKRTGDGLELVQDISFTSLKGDITVYIERLTKISGYVISRETGLVGHEFELREPERILYTGDGLTKVSVNGNESVKMFTNWLNVGGKTGYVVCRNGMENMMTYHYSEDRTRDCDYISLVGESNSEWTSDWACVVTFLNQDQATTATWAKRVDLKVTGNSATCIIGKEKVTVDFGDK